MNAYLINLDRSPQRLAFMRRQLDEIGLPFTRIAAVDGRALAAEERKKRFSGTRSFIASKKRLSSAEIGVALSHIECCRRIVASKEKCALILEDDVVLLDGFADALSRIESFADPNRAQCIILSGYGVPGAESRPEEIVRINSAWCADAYVLTRNAAELILKANDPVITVADSFKRWRKHFGLELYRSFPSTARQDDEAFTSENLVLPKSNWLVRNLMWVLDWTLIKITGR